MPVIAILQVVVDKHTIETRPSCIFFASTVMKQPVWHSPIPEAKAIIEVIAFGVVVVFKAIDNHANSNRKNCKSALINMRHKRDVSPHGEHLPQQQERTTNMSWLVSRSLSDGSFRVMGRTQRWGRRQRRCADGYQTGGDQMWGSDVGIRRVGR